MNSLFYWSCAIFWTALIVFCGGKEGDAAEQPMSFVISPSTIAIESKFESVQIIVTEPSAPNAIADRSRDLTTGAEFVSTNAAVVQVDKQGRCSAVGNGNALIRVTVTGVSQEIPATVSGIVDNPDVGFLSDVRPILNKTGCASGACHASQHGKGGFKLSVFGYDPTADHTAIARARMQRRINLVSPESSLLLLKPTMQVSHGGGRRFTKGSLEYETLRAWIESGAPAPQSDAAELAKIIVTPSRRVCEENDLQQLRVEAEFNDATKRDVTHWAKFDSMDEGVVSVSEAGLVQTMGAGQSAVMVRYEGQAEIAMFVVPYSKSVDLADWKNNNFIDELAAKKFQELGLAPSPLCDDATFIRRAFLDCIGTLPKLEETTAFIDSTDPNKRTNLVDRLLGLTGDPNLDVYNDQYAAFWTLKWSDLIRNSSNKLGDQGMWALHNWIKESFRTNKPFDQFVRELVTAKGSIYMNGPANYFRVNANSSELTESTAQLFLGIRLECAKCHHHPFEKYSQADYYGLASFFSRVGTKNSEEFGLFGRETVVMVRSSGDVSHPRTGKRMEPTPLDGEPIDDPLDRRLPLAKWLTSPENDFFARSVVNRYVGYLLGRGLVEPIDDMRSTNPPSNVEMMDALSESFVKSDFNLKHLVRTIMTSRLYQLSSQPTAENASDHRFYSYYKVKRIAAEPLLDAIDQVTGVQTKFKSLPLGTRAIELPDAEYPNYFLNTFAKPRRASVCECERSPDENLAQALHTLNGDILAAKIADKNGRVAKVVGEIKSHEHAVRQLYLTALCRQPTREELSTSVDFLDQSTTPSECYEDLLWALINSKQFLFVR